MFRDVTSQGWNELDIMPASSSDQASLIHSTTSAYPGDFTLPEAVYDFGASMSQLTCIYAKKL